MPLKRASRGRKKGGKGSSAVVQCTNCGQTVPKDKAKKVTSRLSLVEHHQKSSNGTVSHVQFTLRY